MDNELTLNDMQNINKFTQIANEIAKRNANIVNLQESLKRTKNIQARDFDIRYGDTAMITGCLAMSLRDTIRQEFAEQARPILSNIINQQILNEIGEIKKLIGE